MNANAKVEVENVIRPGKVYRVDAAKYQAMRRAFLQILPERWPGLTADEVRQKVVPILPQDLFPGGATSGWWMKTVQLDLEAKGVVAREKTKPLRLHKA